MNIKYKNTSIITRDNYCYAILKKIAQSLSIKINLLVDSNKSYVSEHV